MASNLKTFGFASLSSIFNQALFKACILLGCVLAFTSNAHAGFLYALNERASTTNQIYGFRVNEETGALTLLAGFPVSSGGNGIGFFFSEELTIDRANRRLYVVNDGSDTVSAFSINAATGALTALPFSPIALPTGAWGTVVVHPSGSPLIVGDGDASPAVASFNITATTAAAATGSPFSTSFARSISIAFSRDSNFIYTGGSANPSIFAGFSVNTLSGVLTPLPGSPFNSGTQFPLAFTTDSNGRIFMGIGVDEHLRVFTTIGGVPTAVAGNPFASALPAPNDGELHPNEKFYYVSDQNIHSVGAYQIAGSGAATTLTPLAGSPVSSGGTQTRPIILNNGGIYLFAGNNVTRNITTYNVSPSSGVLTFGNVQPPNTLGTAGLVNGLAYLPTSIVVNIFNDDDDATPGNGICETLAGSGRCSLRAAVQEANASGGGVITFSSLFNVPRTISLDAGQITISSNITIEGTGANLLTIQNMAAQSTTSRVFNITTGTVNLSGMTISGGNLSGANGGGIANADAGILTLTSCVVSGNSVNFASGGGINNTGILNITNSTISGNFANSLGGAGGITNTNILNITNSTISGNSAISGAAVTIGGGISTSGTTSITNSTITNNSSSSAATSIGAVLSAGSGSNVTVRNSIIAGNVGNNSKPDVLVLAGGTFTSNGFNLIGNVGTVMAFNQTGDQTGTSASVLNPLLLPLANNGGTTPTHALLPTSTAVDKGNRFNIVTDQRGLIRQFDNLAIPNTSDGADIGAFERQAVALDFDGDSRADISVFRPSDNFWYLLNSATGFTFARFGFASDKLTPADYDGDGRTDLAVYRPSDTTWYLQRSQLGFTGVGFGEATDIPQPADMDGDGRAELVNFRPSNGTWYILNLVNNQFTAVQFGASGDHPVAADYDGDGKADIAVYRPSNGTWFLLRSTQGFTGVQFGNSTDKPVVGDYDGDGRADQAVYRPSEGTWYLLRSTQGFTGIQFGISTDLPAPADFDGDGKTDIAVFRGSNGTWFMLKSTQGFVFEQFGAAGDRPIPNAFVP
ncbi:MAG: VCBS repeat-containing protein [Pyrinomonadaceae bacterium]|nr:VCBS repeat-containing protein [Pyrinomonadaceae bacterium]